MYEFKQIAGYIINAICASWRWYVFMFILFDDNYFGNRFYSFRTVSEQKTNIICRIWSQCLFQNLYSVGYYCKLARGYVIGVIPSRSPPWNKHFLVAFIIIIRLFVFGSSLRIVGKDLFLHWKYGRLVLQVSVHMVCVNAMTGVCSYYFYATAKNVKYDIYTFINIITHADVD